MSGIRNNIAFVLNDETIILDQVPATSTLLDYLRLEKGLRGTKEGCAEGDCGACSVLIGRLAAGKLIYESVNSCIRFTGSLNACHIVTVEHLKGKDGQLHPIQQAMVDHHASQCGFCTPGFVMSLYALWMNNPDPDRGEPDRGEIERALQGNLCRCTGYEPIIKAAQAISSIAKADHDPLIKERNNIITKLSDLQDGQYIEIRHGDDLVIIPSSIEELAEARLQHPGSTIISGSTDVGLWVTKHMQSLSPIIFISHLPELCQTEINTDGLNIGACVSYSELQPFIVKYFPQLSELWSRIGGEQVRNMGTIGGNIANGSPIGDTLPPLIALGAQLVLQRGHEQRNMVLEDFFIDYGKQNRQPSDFVKNIYIPFLADNNVFAVYKISKRRDEDISALCGAFRLKLDKGIIRDAVIAFGGMAGTPKRAKTVEQSLIGKPWSEETIRAAQEGFEKDFSPLSDWRAGAQYRTLTAKNLLQRFYIEQTQGSENTRLQRDTELEVSA